MRSVRVELLVNKANCVQARFLGSVIYSFLRFIVRYVAQCRPQFLSTLVTEHSRALRLAIDATYIFVSHTSAADTISVDK